MRTTPNELPTVLSGVSETEQWKNKVEIMIAAYNGVQRVADYNVSKHKPRIKCTHAHTYVVTNAPPTYYYIIQ